MIEKSRICGSEEYNAPELNQEDNSGKYDSIKGDVFSAATTLFLMVMRCPPFRKAHPKDPYYKRLCA